MLTRYKQVYFSRPDFFSTASRSFLALLLGLSLVLFSLRVTALNATSDHSLELNLDVHSTLDGHGGLLWDTGAGYADATTFKLSKGRQNLRIFVEAKKSIHRLRLDPFSHGAGDFSIYRVVVASPASNEEIEVPLDQLGVISGLEISKKSDHIIFTAQQENTGTAIALYSGKPITWQPSIVYILITTSGATIIWAGFLLVLWCLLRQLETAECIHSTRKLFTTWLLILVSCAAMLALRYSWTAELAQYSFRSWVASVYMLVFLLPVLHSTLNLFPTGARHASSLVFLTGIVATLPYDLFLLKEFFYNKEAPAYYFLGTPGVPKPHFAWLPNALSDSQAIPYEIPFFLGLTLVGLILIRYFSGQTVLPPGKKQYSKAFPYLALLAISFQSWLHVSARSPYNYRALFFEDNLAKGYWYNFYMFAGGRGLVQGDYFTFRNTEELFFGLAKVVEEALLIRALPMYLSSQFSYFINPIYPWIVINIGLWCLALFAIYRMGTVIFSESTGRYAAAITALSPLFIQYITQPMGYVAGYASIPFLLLVTYQVFQNSNELGLRQILFLGSAWGIALLCFEHHPWLLVVFIWGIYRSIPWFRLLFSLTLALIISNGFTLLMLCFDSVKLLSTAKELYAPGIHLMSLIANFRITKLFGLLTIAAGQFAENMTCSFGISLVLAVLIIFMGLTPIAKIALLALLAPAVMTQIYMQFSPRFNYASSPRIVAIAFPAIYLSCGAVLDWLGNASWLQSDRVRKLVVYLIFATFFLFANIDVFGYPAVYYLLHWQADTSELLFKFRGGDL